MSDRTKLPPGWKQTNLGTLGAFTNGINKGAEDFGFGVRFVNLLDVFGKSGIDDFPSGLVNATAPEIERYSLREGDVIFIRSSVKPSGVGLTAVIEKSLPQTVYSGFLIRFRPEPCQFETSFLRYCFYNEDFRREMISKSTVSANANINQVSLGQLKVALPPPPQQRRIATILSTLDEVIEATEKLVEKHQQIKAGLMHDLFTRGLWTRPELARGDHKGLPCEATAQEGQLRPPPEQAPGLYQDSPLGLIPKEWEVVRLDTCVPESRPIVYGILMPGTGHEGGIPVIKVKDIRNERVDLSDILLTSPEIDQQYARAKTKAGDVLFTIRGSVGRVARVPEVLDGANITQDTARISAGSVDPNYLLGFLTSHTASKYASVHTLGVAVQGINLGELRAMPVARPKCGEQEQIGGRLTSINVQIETEKEHLAKLRQQKQGLMHDLLTGRVRVEPN